MNQSYHHSFKKILIHIIHLDPSLICHHHYILHPKQLFLFLFSLPIFCYIISNS